MDSIALGTVLLAVITGTGEAISGQLWTQLVSLTHRPRMHKASAGSQAVVSSGEPELAALQQFPHDQQKAVALAEALLARAGVDVGFGRALQEWWAQAEPIRASSENVSNIISGGTQHGPVLQGRDFGNLTFGATAPPPVPPGDPGTRR